MNDTALRTLGLQEAAALVRLHKNTLQDMAKSGRIPGAKVGRRWLFIEADLIDYIRKLYQPEATKCHSINAKAALSGGSASRSKVAPGYVSQLEKRLAQRRSNATQKSK